MVNAISIPETIPGFICGKTTFLSAYQGVAPKSMAASSIFAGNCFNFGSTDKITYGISKTICDNNIVVNPNSNFIKT